MINWLLIDDLAPLKDFFCVFQVIPTELRANPLYYRVYYVHLNTIFASIIPLISLVRSVVNFIKLFGHKLQEYTFTPKRL